ncbi:hypothetical protein NIES2135_20570 [Leptolyngbya boryana NIES-2135]|jgi:hypothetical protein|uniref:Uncharacterized protein n=1 Tax=Leptolyngbya boryana NIES-2135 TaxID=1973484 RepID=A0A1Z4JEM5_LEPBY|nr:MULTISPECIES: hypothetical protein [Leptolyngbya]BAY55234.1 hypothetical protein NIES2135_20570 [Leptolyngbya boryana NIES-2135]MBD2369320.1 hypothetical protein [Leptolyngbya sp. FACHB-161]MBD2375678.1 hypothetical protein [Leptolyngbya sp. FACHB-238]MBD2401649.1 hypothetical protein [Leptolyngbya sp. FACHB-239]MBD2406612.1 hypothetical protein [Leptolyngbya sp. FACHB-402]
MPAKLGNVIKGFRLPPALISTLEREVDRTQRIQSDILVEAIEQYFRLRSQNLEPYFRQGGRTAWFSIPDDVDSKIRLEAATRKVYPAAIVVQALTEYFNPASKSA